MIFLNGIMDKRTIKLGNNKSQNLTAVAPNGANGVSDFILTL